LSFKAIFSIHFNAFRAFLQFEILNSKFLKNSRSLLASIYIFYILNAIFTPPPAAKMRWPAPIRARLPPCERRPGEQQFGRASEAQSGVGIVELGGFCAILNLEDNRF